MIEIVLLDQLNKGFLKILMTTNDNVLSYGKKEGVEILPGSQVYEIHLKEFKEKWSISYIKKIGLTKFKKKNRFFLSRQEYLIKVYNPLDFGESFFIVKELNKILKMMNTLKEGTIFEKS